MINWLEQINDAWNDLLPAVPVARQYRTKLLSADVPLNILAAIRAIDNAPCLILQTTIDQDSLFELSGMRLQLVSDESEPLLVLSLEDESRRDLFSTICADVVSAAFCEDGIMALTQFLARLDAWRQFLRDRRAGLSRSETIGLIGELIVLDRLLDINPQILSTWKAPIDGLHDFCSYGHALEVKSTLGPTSSITISRLDQLDTAGLRRLDLLFVRLIETPDGFSLQKLIQKISDKLPNNRERFIFKNDLIRRGMMPDDNAALDTLKVELRTVDAYSVSYNFPRLIRANLPSAIIEATYTLDVRAITPFISDPEVVLDKFAREVS